MKRLASRVAALASLPVEAEKRDLWRRHNDLEATRPLVICDPENGWNEIIPQDQLRCEGDLARNWEFRLRKEVFWGESMGDDHVIEPVFNVGHVHTRSDWGLPIKKVGGENGGACNWEFPLESYDDLKKLRVPTIEVDYQATEAMLRLTKEILGESLDVRLRSGWWWTQGMTGVMAQLRGLEQIMLDMYDEPENLTRFIEFMRDAHLAIIDFLQGQNLLSPNHDGGFIASGGYGYTNQLPQKDFNPNHVTTMDMWGFSESQETVGVSPEMFAEFIFPYQLPLLERFGLNCYGCCEPVDKRWHVIKAIPRLRRVSVSAWADIEAMAENLGDRYIYSCKPQPARLATPVINEDVIRKDLRRVLDATRGCRLEMIMKDNHTLGKNPQNAVRWVELARGEVAKSGY